MGSRANIYIPSDRDRENGVYFYTHWDGNDAPIKLKKALAKRWRWDDHAYLSRIIFCELVKGYEMDETGFGISTERIGDNFPLITVNVHDQQVAYTPGVTALPQFLVSFEEYVSMSDEDILKEFVDKE